MAEAPQVQASKISIVCRPRGDQVILKTSLTRATDVHESKDHIRKRMAHVGIEPAPNLRVQVSPAP